MLTTTDSLGPPAIHVAGLQLWVHGRQFPDSFDSWDGNWLNVSAHCQALGSSVWASGPLIMATDVAHWLKQCHLLYEGGDGDAKLQPLEPNLAVTISALDQLGHLEMRVEITPHHMTQWHRVSFEIDQSYLPSLMRQCRAILEEYPVRRIAGA